jgi:hypothetical protein
VQPGDRRRRAAALGAHEHLVEACVGEWMEPPLGITDPGYAGMLRADNRRAVVGPADVPRARETIRVKLELARPVDSVRLAPELETTRLATGAGRSPA